MGRPHRAKYLAEVLDYVMSHDRVWHATTDEIADYYLAHYYDAAVAHASKIAMRAVPVVERRLCIALFYRSMHHDSRR